MKVVSSSTLGFPRMGPRRELKFALEKFWKKGSTFSEAELLSAARAVEEQAWALQAAKVDKVTVGDHYLYDGVLTWTEYLGIFPKRFNGQKPGLERMFAMARGADGSPALSKFPTNTTPTTGRLLYARNAIETSRHSYERFHCQV